MRLDGPIVGTPYHLKHVTGGWAVMRGTQQVAGPLPFWTLAWIAAKELAG